MSLWGRLLAALGRRDPARLMAQGQAELTRAGRLLGPTVLPVLGRATAAFEAAASTGVGAEATLGIARALRLKAQHSPPEATLALRARGVALLKAALFHKRLARDPVLHAAVLQALSEAWEPLPQEPAATAQALALLTRARDAQSAVVAALDRTLHPQPWSAALLRQAELDQRLSVHPRCLDAAAHRRAALTALHLGAEGIGDPPAISRRRALEAALHAAPSGPICP